MSSSIVTYEISKLWAPSRDAELFIALMLDIFQTTSQVIYSQLIARIKRWNLAGVQPVDTLEAISMNKPHRSIMVIGETGTGKTTLLNSMANHLWNVSYDDPYRFKLIYEDVQQYGDAQSVTNHVTAYHLNPPALDYQLTVIDTPGFGDTRGLAHDQTITRQIKQCFESKIQEIDAVCFVVRASQARLTAAQKYIFNQVLSIFGKDIAKNIMILMTFADGKKPPVLSALKAGNVPFTHAFKLNNSGFDLREFEDKDDDDEEDEDEDDMFTRMFWDMGVSSFRNLFGALNQFETKSLNMTQQVLSQRETLDRCVERMLPLLRRGFAQLEEMRRHIIVIKQHDAVMVANKDFTYKTYVRKARQIPNNGQTTTTCLECNYTCHRGCPYSNNADKARCNAMDGNGYCQVCPSKCHWSLHKNKPYAIEYSQVEQTRTTQELKDKYNVARNKQCAEVRSMARGALTQLSAVDAELQELIDKSRRCLDKLEAIALRPNVIFEGDYIDKLLESEESEKATGWHQRVNVLKGLKEKQAILSGVGVDKYNPWRPYLDVQSFICKNENVSEATKDESIVKMLAHWSTLLY